MEEAIRMIRAALAAVPEATRQQAAEAAVAAIVRCARAPHDKGAIVRALAEAGDVRGAAELLHCSRRTLQYRMRELGIEAPLKGRAPWKLTAASASGTVAE